MYGIRILKKKFVGWVGFINPTKTGSSRNVIVGLRCANPTYALEISGHIVAGNGRPEGPRYTKLV